MLRECEIERNLHLLETPLTTDPYKITSLTYYIIMNRPWEVHLNVSDGNGELIRK